MLPDLSSVDEHCSDSILQTCAQKLKVCGHPIRLKLLCAIAREQEPCVSELWVCLQQPQPVVSQHLAILKEKGIVQSEVKGNKRIYSIVDPFVQQIVDSLQGDLERIGLTAVG
jgi:DNA-binding transcriptional ArsR family regulator